MSKIQDDKVTLEFSLPIQRRYGETPERHIKIPSPFQPDRSGVPSAAADRLTMEVTRTGVHPFIGCFVSGGIPRVPSAAADRLTLAVTRTGFHPFHECFVSGGLVVLNLFEEEIEAFQKLVFESDPTLQSAVTNSGPLDIWRFVKWDTCFVCENGNPLGECKPVETRFRSAKIPMEHAAKVTDILEGLSESPCARLEDIFGVA